MAQHITVKEYDPAWQELYEREKALAEKFPYDIEGYCEGKDAFVRRVEALALACYDGSRNRL